MEDFTKTMVNTVLHLIYSADLIWQTVGCMDDVIDLVRGAKIICTLYGLEELELVHQFENHVVDDWKWCKAREAEEELRRRFSDGFADGI